MPQNYVNRLTGFRTQSQLRLNAKEGVASEAVLKDLGLNNNLAFVYEKGLIVYCNLEGTRYEWKEVPVGKELTGLRSTDFIYPAGVITDGVDYSNKKYNFFKIESLLQENSDWNSTSGVSRILNKPFIPTIVPQVQTDWNASTGLGVLLNKPNIVIPPFDKINNSYFIRGRNETQFGDLGEYSIDFSDADLGAFGDAQGQVGKIGVNPTELYGSLADSCFTFGYNSANNAYGSFLASTYSHIDTQGSYSSVYGRNNYSNSYCSFIAGTYNQTPFTFLGHKTVFGNGNIVNGAASLTSGVALLNKSFGTIVLGQANLDYTNTEQDHANQLAPLLIVGNGTVAVPAGLWSAITRSNAFVLLRNGLATLPSVTNTLITNDVSGKALITKEYLTSVLPAITDGSETKINASTNINISGTGTIANPYILSSNDTNTTYSAGLGLTLTNATFSIDNLQKVITYPTNFTGTNYTLTSADNNYEIIVDNGTTNVSITVPNGLISKIGTGFTQKGTGDVAYIASGTVINTPIGLKIKGQYYQTYLSQEANTNIYYLGGNTKI